MKHIQIILGLLLFASVTTFAQSPRIKLNQITKDTVKGSVLISSPSDSGMVYSRDFYIAYGLTDTVLILYGDTLAATSGIISSVLSDGVTITGNGTSGNELKVDTSLIATIKALNDSLATISASTTPDGVTITGDGSVGNPLKVDTATVISTIQGLVDTLSARGYLTANQTITLSGDVTGSGTTAITATVVDDSHNHIISNVDFLQDSLNAKANDSDLANYVTIAGTDTITGAKTFTNTFTQSGGDANFDSGTLYVDESENRVGIGTSSPLTNFNVNSFVDSNDLSRKILFGNSILYNARQGFAEFGGTHNFNVDNSAYMYFSPTFNLKLSSFFPFSYVPNINLESNVSSYYNFLSIMSLKTTNGYTLTDYDNAFYRNDFYATTGYVTNSRTFRIISPYFASGSAIKPTNQYGIEIMNQGASGITTSYGLNIASQSGSTNNYALYIGGGTVEIDGLSNVSATPLHIDANGVVTKFSSSIRYKTEIKDYDKGLDYLMKINPVWFTYKSSGQTNAGFIAEQIHEAGLEEFVTYTDEGIIEGLKGEHLKPLIVKAIQEQQAIIETQANEIDQLKTLITDLTNRLTILENK